MKTEFIKSHINLKAHSKAAYDSHLAKINLHFQAIQQDNNPILWSKF